MHPIYRHANDGFNPRSRAGSDAVDWMHTIFHGGFNPRSRAGSDDFFKEHVQRLDGFNPRSRAGSDFRLLIFLHPPLQFQSTLPRGERQ